MKRVRGGAGLGDAIYLRPIVEYLLAADRVTVCTDYGEVFLNCDCAVEPFRRNGVDVLAHYTAGKCNPDTTQYQDMLNAARITQPVPLCFSWTVRNQDLVDDLEQQAAGRPLILVHGGRAPYGRIDGFGMELVPTRDAFNTALRALSDSFTVQVGKAAQIYPLRTTLDLNGRTSVSDLLDIASVCDGVVAMCSWAVPAAEVFDRPLLAVWSARGLASAEPYVSQTTPRKILSKPSSRYVMDDWEPARIREAARAFCDL